MKIIRQSGITTGVILAAISEAMLNKGTAVLINCCNDKDIAKNTKLRCEELIGKMGLTGFTIIKHCNSIILQNTTYGTLQLTGSYRPATHEEYNKYISASKKHGQQSLHKDRVKRKPITIKQARQTIINAFKKDPSFRKVYTDNIACFIMDNIPGFAKNHDKRNEIADKLLRFILG